MSSEGRARTRVAPGISLPAQFRTCVEVTNNGMRRYYAMTDEAEKHPPRSEARLERYRLANQMRYEQVLSFGNELRLMRRDPEAEWLWAWAYWCALPFSLKRLGEHMPEELLVAAGHEHRMVQVLCQQCHSWRWPRTREEVDALAHLGQLHTCTICRARTLDTRYTPGSGRYQKEKP